MLGIEKKVIYAAVTVLVVMLSLLIYSIYGLGIGLPNCVTTVKPFQKGEIIKKADGFYEVHIVAKMWNFEPHQIEVPPGSTLDIFLSSSDVTHGFQIENTNVNLMAVPGTVNYARVKLTDSGVYHFVCHEYCGVGHQAMAGAIVVGDKLETELLLTEYKLENGAKNSGQSLFTTKGCVACHSIDGKSGAGPTFKGMFGKLENLTDGSSVNIDEAYIAESIKNPTAKVVKGFQPVMPPLPVSDEEIKEITNYIKTLK